MNSNAMQMQCLLYNLPNFIFSLLFTICMNFFTHGQVIFLYLHDLGGCYDCIVGTQEGGELGSEDTWDHRPAAVPGTVPSSFREPTAKRPYPQTLISGPSLLPLPTPSLPPTSLAAATGPPDPSGFHGVVPTSSGGGAAMSGQPVDWAQLQVQMQVLSQNNPAFYAQMQQFFWSQNMLQMQHQQQMHAAAVAATAQGYHHLQQTPTAAGGAAVSATPSFTGGEGEYNMAAAAGGAGAQYHVQMGLPPGGLFIPPMAHIPSPHHHHHMGEETDASQSPRRSLAIPIVPPKVCVCRHMYILHIIVM